MCVGCLNAVRSRDEEEIWPAAIRERAGKVGEFRTRTRVPPPFSPFVLFNARRSMQGRVSSLGSGVLGVRRGRRGRWFMSLVSWVCYIDVYIFLFLSSFSFPPNVTVLCFSVILYLSWLYNPLL